MRRSGSQKFLVIPDTHALPGYDNERFTWLGKLCADIQFDRVIHLGDHWDMPGSGRHEKPGSKAGRMASIKEDIDAGNDGMERFWAPQRNIPRADFCMGNHDIRPEALVSEDPKLDGLFGRRDLFLDGWRVWEYGEICQRKGFAFCHHLFTDTGGAVGYPSLMRRAKQSVFVGHNHGLLLNHDPGATKHMTAFSPGYFGHPQYGVRKDPRTSWCRAQRSRWFSSVMILHGVGTDEWSRLEIATMRDLEREYGNRRR